MGQNYAVTDKILKDCVDQNQVIVGGYGDPNLTDAARLTPPNSASLLESLTMIWSVHVHLHVVLNTFLGRKNPTTHRLAMFRQALTYQEMYLEE